MQEMSDEDGSQHEIAGQSVSKIYSSPLLLRYECFATARRAPRTDCGGKMKRPN